MLKPPPEEIVFRRVGERRADRGEWAVRDLPVPDKPGFTDRRFEQMKNGTFTPVNVYHMVTDL